VLDKNIHSNLLPYQHAPMKERRLVFCGCLGPRATGVKRLGRETDHLTAIWFRGQE